MILINPKWEHKIQLNDGSSTLLVIENPELFRTYIRDLIVQTETDEGPFVLSDEKEESIKDHLVVITDLLKFNVVDKKVSSKLLSLLKIHIMNETNYPMTMKVLSEIETYAEAIEEDFPFVIKHEEIDTTALLKIIGFDVQTEYDSDIDKILEYMNILHDFCGMDCFCLIGMQNYFSAETINTFLKETSLLKHNILLLERFDINEIKANQKIIIDKDSCEIFS